MLMSLDPQLCCDPHVIESCNCGVFILAVIHSFIQCSVNMRAELWKVSEVI